MNYQTLILMIADAPRYVDGKEKQQEEKSAEEEADDIVGFYRSELSK